MSDSEDFDFQKQVGGEEVQVEDITEEEELEDDHGENVIAVAMPYESMPTGRQEHGDSTVTATTATTDEDGDTASYSTYPTPVSAPKQRIVELSRGYDDPEEVSDDFTSYDGTPQATEETKHMEQPGDPDDEITETGADDFGEEEFERGVEEEPADEEWEQLPAFEPGEHSLADELYQKKHHKFPQERPLRSHDSIPVVASSKGDPTDSVDDYEDDQKPPRSPVVSARDGTTTYENWMAIRVGSGQWQERYGVVQPSQGLFAFEDDLAANDWRRNDQGKASYELRLMISCEDLKITPDSELSSEADEATAGEYGYAIRLSNGKDSLVVIAVPESANQEWMAALEGARPLADYLACCEKLQVTPSSLLIRSAMTSPPLRSIELTDCDLSDVDVLETICQFAISTGRNLHTLRLEKCKLTDEGALLLRQTLLRLPSMQELDLTDNPGLKEAGVCAVVSGLIHNRLRSVVLRNCDVGDDAALEICELVARSPLLEHLDIGRNHVSSLSGVRLAVTLPHCPQLRELSFGDNPELQDEFVGALSGVLSALQLLTRLDLSGIKMSDWGLHYLEKGLKDPVPLGPGLNDSSDSAGNQFQLEQAEWERIDLRNNPTITEHVATRFLEGLSQYMPVDDVVLFSFPALRINNRLELGETPKILALTPTGPPNSSVSSFIVVTFAGSPVPTRDRLRDVLRQCLGIRAGRIRVRKYTAPTIEEKDNHEVESAKEQMEVEITEDPEQALAGRAETLVGDPKLALLRVESIRRRPIATPSTTGEQNALHYSPSMELARSSQTASDRALAVTIEESQTLSLVSLEMLTVAVSDALLSPSEANLVRLRRDFDSIKHTLPPLLRSSVEIICTGPHPGTGDYVTKAIIAAACGLSMSCDAALAGEMAAKREYDLVSAVQCAAVLGDLRRLRLAVSKRAIRDMPSFAKRLADILIHSYPFRFASEFPLKSYGRLIDPKARPLTRPLPGAQLQQLSLDEQEALFAQHQAGCDRVFRLIQMCLGYEPRTPDDVDGSAAMNELFGVALKNPSLIAELHLDLVLRTCSTDTTMGKAPIIVWVLALLALRCVPPKQKGIAADARLHLALLASYKNHYDRTQDPMALHCIRALEMNDHVDSQFLVSRPMKRMEYIRRSLRMDRVQLSVNLPDGRAVLVEAVPFSTFLDLLVAVDAKLATESNLGERWRGYHFVERSPRPWSNEPTGSLPGELQEDRLRLLPFGEDPSWWYYCSRANPSTSNAKLCLEEIVSPSFVPVLVESDPECPDDQMRGDAVRVAMSFATEKRVLKEQTVFAIGGRSRETRAVAYCMILACLEQMGEEQFRVCSLSEFLRVCEVQFPISLGADDDEESIHAELREAIDEFRASLLAMPRGSFPRDTCRAALVQYARLWPLSGAFSSMVYPKQICSAGTVIDASLPPLARLSVSSRGGLFLLAGGGDYRSCLWSCDLRSLARLDHEPSVNEIRFVCQGNDDWISVRFASEYQAQTFRQVMLSHLWATLAYCGVAVSRMAWLEEFTFRFPQLPSPPLPPKHAVPPGGSLRTRISKSATDVRIAAQVIVDSLFRPKFAKSSLPTGAFFFGPLEQSEITPASALFASTSKAQLTLGPMAINQDDAVEALLALPPLSPPPAGNPGILSHKYPVPFGHPEEDEGEDDGIIIRPPSHPPPPMASTMQMPPVRMPNDVLDQQSKWDQPSMKRTYSSSEQVLPVPATPIMIPLPPTDPPTPSILLTQSAPVLAMNEAPVVQAAQSSASSPQPAAETEEEAKARMKREFLKRRREKEQHVQES